MEHLENIEFENGINNNSEKGTLLMTQALKKYAEGDFEGGDIDREKANKYFDLAKMEINGESANITQLYGENRNFGIVYKVLESNFTNSLQDNSINKKPLIEAFKKVKKSKKLNEQFKVFNAFTNPQNVVDPVQYVNEVISLCNIHNQKDLNDVNENFINFIQKNNINELIDIEDNEMELFESINYIITNKKGFNNINEYIHHKDVIVDYVNKHNVMNNDQIDIDEKLNECALSLEEKYDILLNDDEKEFIKEYANKQSKEECFNENKKVLIDLIEKRIKNVDTCSKEQWIELKNKINESVFNEKKFIIDLAKIIEIQNKLN